MELVSVIITTYNRNDKFERALKSVLNQNYPNIEIIIVNDYPGDDYELVKIINKYSKLTNFKIKYKKNDVNLGAPLSRNEGIKETKGKYSCFLDDDDVFLPLKISEQVKYIKKSNTDFCYVFSKIYRNGKLRKIVENRILEDDQLSQAVTKTFGGTSSLLFKREVLENVNGFLKIPCGQEWELECRCILNGYKMGYVDKVLLYTYENSNELSITNSKNERKIKELYKYKFFYCNKISNMEIRDKIARKLNIEYRIQKIFYSDKKNNILLYFKQFDKKNPYYSLKLIMKFIIKVFLKYD